ncbi:MAG TPA: hypothetical protein VHN77_15400 [Phycisphaerales bacterium]|nr:hypothetical protein [Phycisphaerales bacterium]
MSSDPAQGPAPTPPPAISEDELKRAFNAFKKRLKVTRLDQESRLGASRPMTAGKKADDISINPPNDFPREVWKELARLGRIKDTGGGFYKMP